MKDTLIKFQIYLNEKNLINNHDWDFEKEAKKFIKQKGFSNLKLNIMKLEVSKEFVLEAHKEACSDWKQRIEKEFPSFFENKFKNGDWIKLKKYGGNILIRITDLQKAKAYGIIYSGEWTSDSEYQNWSFKRKPNDWTLATEEEVETALIAEAKKRGFKDGVYHSITDGDKIIKPINENFGFDIIKNKLLFNNWCIFEKGKWAEIIQEQEMTIEQIEKELGRKIKIVN